eukprot:15483028-Alexandrium_andersonii.AAC.1
MSSSLVTKGMFYYTKHVVVCFNVAPDRATASVKHEGPEILTWQGDGCAYMSPRACWCLCLS